MALTLVEILASLRLDEQSNQETVQHQDQVVLRMEAAARAVVNVTAPTAPEVVVDQAVLRMVGWMYDRDPAAGTQYAHAMRNSGALSLLQFWIPRGSVVIGAGDASGGGAGGLDQSSVLALVEEWAQQGNEDPIPIAKLANAARAAIDQTARDAAAEAANPDAATDSEADAGTETALRSWSPALVFRSVRAAAAAATEALRGNVLLARDVDVDDETDLSRVPTLAAAIRLWRRLRGELNEVPDTPGTSSSIGHVLTVTGEGDKDRAWRAAPAGSTGRQRSFGSGSGDIAAWAEGDSAATIPSGKLPALSDSTARDAAAAAQLDADTVIRVGPAFHPGETAARNIYVSIRHPLNAYRQANILSVAVQGQSPVLVAYDPNTLQADFVMEVPATAMQNIANAGHLTLGNYLAVDVRLTQGRNGAVQFDRIVDVPVVAAPAAAAGAGYTETLIGSADTETSSRPLQLTHSALTAATSGFLSVWLQQHGADTRQVQSTIPVALLKTGKTLRIGGLSYDAPTLPDLDGLIATVKWNATNSRLEVSDIAQIGVQERRSVVTVTGAAVNYNYDVRLFA